jgi:hypothetical protein
MTFSIDVMGAGISQLSKKIPAETTIRAIMTKLIMKSRIIRFLLQCQRQIARIPSPSAMPEQPNIPAHRNSPALADRIASMLSSATIYMRTV